MRCLALACDYDGTLAFDGQVSEATLSALKRINASGRKLLLVTGRELPDLREVFHDLDLFDRAVVENGALLYHPATREQTLLAVPPPQVFVNLLRERQVHPLSVGQGIVATLRTQAPIVAEAIRELGIGWRLIFNKESLMVLPETVNKATGLRAALASVGVKPENVAAIGDAENDLPFLSQCGYSAAVANALDVVKEQVHFVTQKSRGEGVVELIDMILTDDLHSLARGSLPA
jgi:hydroxymethylpyrimidine pyrophosphatase-like HAD family hydrolase